MTALHDEFSPSYYTQFRSLPDTRRFIAWCLSEKSGVDQSNKPLLLAALDCFLEVAEDLFKDREVITQEQLGQAMLPLQGFWASCLQRNRRDPERFEKSLHYIAKLTGKDHDTLASDGFEQPHIDYHNYLVTRMPLLDPWFWSMRKKEPAEA